MEQINPIDTADREIVLSRLLDAPRELVFAAWTDPEQVVQWWGPRGFTTTNHEMSVTPGGVWSPVAIARIAPRASTRVLRTARSMCAAAVA